MTPSNSLYCDVCGAEIPANVVAYVHSSYLYCPRCEVIHRNNEQEAARRGKTKRG